MDEGDKPVDGCGSGGSCSSWRLYRLRLHLLAKYEARQPALPSLEACLPTQHHSLDSKYRSVGFFSLEVVQLGECPLTDNVGCCHTICVNSRYYVKFRAWRDAVNKS